ncbi:MAG: carboxypeptidase M32 [Bradymonadales bacterium]|nr:carboxypeptidase M32 [Bradymonadales bacterium]
MTQTSATNDRMNRLKDRLREIGDLQGAVAVLGWDQATYMPSAGAAGRGRQLALISRIEHERATDPELGKLLEDLLPTVLDLPPESMEKALVEVAWRDYIRAVRVPAEFVSRLEEHAANSFETWKRARQENNFGLIRPYLERTVELSRELADFFPGYASVADPLIDYTDEGFTAAYLRELFSQLTCKLVPLVDAVCRKPEMDDSCLRQEFALDRQREFGEAVIRDLGYDFERGRQDLAPHPFMTRLSGGDMRITTRYNPSFLAKGLFGTIHEAGHALYEQGVDLALDGSPLGTGTTHGVHESQSRLWENLVGRSRPFWIHYYPRLQRLFPEQLTAVSLEEFYRAINKVSRSLIRTEADELTYNLHVVIRFDLELDLLEGKLEVADLPERWNELYEERLGIRPSTDSDGVLQDMHWYQSLVGGQFQSYTLGNIMSAQFFQAALASHPEITEEMAQGRFDTLRNWLVSNVYRPGRSIPALKLVERVTGKPLEMQPYMRMLEQKYGELYGL